MIHVAEADLIVEASNKKKIANMHRIEFASSLTYLV